MQRGFGLNPAFAPLQKYNNLFSLFGAVAQGRFGMSTADVQAVFPRQTYTPIQVYA